MKKSWRHRALALVLALSLLLSLTALGEPIAALEDATCEETFEQAAAQAEAVPGEISNAPEPAPETADEPTPEAADAPTTETADEPTPEIADAPTPETTEEPTPEAADAPTSEIADAATPGTEDSCSHSFENGVCVACNYACPHVEATLISEYEGEIDVTDVDAERHSVVFDVCQNMQCTICNYSFTQHETQTREEPHSYSEERCTCACGHINHQGVEDYMRLTEPYTYEYVSVSFHKKYGRLEEGKYCYVCGAEWGNKVLDKTACEVDLQHHTYENGVCTGCGAMEVVECPHEHTYVMDNYCQDAVYTQLENRDPKRHLVSGTLIEEIYCADCGKFVENRATENASREESHELYEGKCICGYVSDCAHANTTQSIAASSGTMLCRPNDAKTHLWFGECEMEYTCLDCGEVWEDYTGIWSGSEGVPVPHEYAGDGSCKRCGYVCAHPQATVVSEEVMDDPVYEQLDAQKHSVATQMRRNMLCPDCGVEFVKVETLKVEQDHDFVAGVCEDCGYVKPCTHAYIGVAEHAKVGEYTAIDAEKHAGKGNIVRETYCLVCGEEISREVIEGGVETVNVHCFWNGVCEDCGYVSACSHAQTAEETYYGYDCDVQAFDESGHTYLRKQKIVQTVCANCGECLGSERFDISEKVIEPHDFVGDACAVCGYATGCAHGNTRVEEEKAYLWVLSSDAEGHKVCGDWMRSTICEDCGSLIRREIAQNKVWTEGHDYEGDSCAVCAHERPQNTSTPAPTMPAATVEPTPRPTAKPTAKPTATPEPTVEPTVEPTEEPVVEPTPTPDYVEVPADEPVHGVKAEDELKIVEAMIIVGDEAAAQGEEMTIEIVNAEKILAPEEKAALEVLPVKEQLLTFLSVIGFEEHVNRTLEAVGESLSTEAVTLKEQIQARVAAMDEEELAAFEATLLESFPQEVIAIDGVEYSFFVLELEVRTGGSVRYERYGFRREGDDWIFTRLEIAK